MIQLVIEREQYLKIWEQNSLHVLQHFDWGELKASESWKIIRVHDDKGSVVQIQTKKIPLFPYHFGYVPKMSAQQMGSDVKEWAVFMKEHNLAFLIFEFKDQQRGSRAESLTDTPIHIQPQQSNVVDLRKSEEDLFMAMDGKYRRNIKKAYREGVNISFFSEGQKPLEQFYSIMSEIFANTKLLERDKDYYQKLWDLLKGKAYIALADYQEACIGAYLLVTDNIGCYELYGGVSKQGRDLEAGYALKWEAIKYARSLGLEQYDHWGVAPLLVNGDYDPKHELYRISGFKRGFGGSDVVFPGAKVLILNKMAYSSFLMAKNLADWKIKLSKRF
jgi:lipid II:glycine glycyltransferase (peptidoglycan interpeptide bridge formation enzyme)